MIFVPHLMIQNEDAPRLALSLVRPFRFQNVAGPAATGNVQFEETPWHPMTC